MIVSCTALKQWSPRVCVVPSPSVWQVLALVQKLLLEGKVATQREAYYCLVQHFRSQGEFNDTLQGQWNSLETTVVYCCTESLVRELKDS